MTSLKPISRIKKFEEMGFGLFIHWGLYSQLGKGEWVQEIENIPLKEYVDLKESFHADKFDARAIVKMAKAAGMKYITLTTRHHDGFSLYDTKGLNTYDALHSPAKRDLVREFVGACHEEDIAPFFYHTTLDWYNEDFEKDFDGYLEYLAKSIEILSTEYGKIGGFWFDGNWSKPDADWQLDKLYKIIRKHQPQAIIINNTGLDHQGVLEHPEIDSVTFEQGLPKPKAKANANIDKYVAGEMCYSMNDHWGLGEFDLNYKSPAELIKVLCNCRKLGGNLLLNIGPNGDGSVAHMMQATLSVIGQWMDIFGESIYKGRPTDIIGNKDNFILKGNEGKYYIFIFDLPIVGDDNVVVAGEKIFPSTFTGVKEGISSIKWMDNQEDLSFIQDTESGILTIKGTGFNYGSNYIVRVAEANIEGV